jgi:hypothetical protein
MKSIPDSQFQLYPVPENEIRGNVLGIEPLEVDNGSSNDLLTEL